MEKIENFGEWVNHMRTEVIKLPSYYKATTSLYDFAYIINQGTDFNWDRTTVYKIEKGIRTLKAAEFQEIYSKAGYHLVCAQDIDSDDTLSRLIKAEAEIKRLKEEIELLKFNLHY